MQFVGKVITSVSEFYKDINPSTLSGAIDVLVVEDVTTGQLSCSPFHVRFGKLQLLRPQEKVVQVCVNGKPVERVKMKVGEAGETFFVLPAQGAIPEEYLTSPLSTPLSTTAAVETLSLSSPEKEGRVVRGGSRALSSDSEMEIEVKGERMGPLSDSELELAQSGMTSSNRGGVEGEKMEVKLHSSKDQSKTSTSPVISTTDSISSSIDLSTGKSSKTRSTTPSIKSESIGEGTSEGTSGSSPKWTWMWGGLPRKETKEETATSTTAASNSQAPVPIDSPTISNPSSPRPSEMVDIFDYVNRPTVLRRMYDKFVSFAQSRPFDISIYKCTPTTNETFLVDLAMLEQDGIQMAKIDQVLQRLEKIEWERYVEDPTATLTELFSPTSKTLLSVESEMEKVLFSGIIGYTLLMGKTLFGTLLSYEAILRAWPTIIDSSAGERKGSGGSASASGGGGSGSGSGWRWWSRTGELNAGGELSPRSSLTSPVPPTNPTPEGGTKYAKSLRLPHDLLMALNLQPGVNTITFSVTTRLQGTATCMARIFRWPSNIRFIVSDIDGTITKSDALGHLFTMVGKDWTHLGVANLFSKIAHNGYHFVYLTSRALGQANSTRGYLKGIAQDKFQLPEGPVIMSPDRLLAALRREVVVGNPQEFKIACLRDIQQLFHFNPSSAKSQPNNPFYAGFGNRTTDVSAYLAVDIPPQRIFIINPSGTVAVEPLADQYPSSYIQLTELVDSIFPPILATNQSPTEDEPYNEFWYWRRPLTLAPLHHTLPLMGGAEEVPGVASNLSLDMPLPTDEEDEEEGLVPAYYI